MLHGGVCVCICVALAHIQQSHPHPIPSNTAVSTEPESDCWQSEAERSVRSPCCREVERMGCGSYSSERERERERCSGPESHRPELSCSPIEEHQTENGHAAQFKHPEAKSRDGLRVVSRIPGYGIAHPQPQKLHSSRECLKLSLKHLDFHCTKYSQ